MIKTEVVAVAKEKIIKPVQYFVFGVVVLLSIYFVLMSITTGSIDAALYQFMYFRPWILALSVGFGIQLAMYKLIKIKHMETMGTGKVAKVTGATSTATMVACCAHHALDVLPIVGASALASFLGAYTKEFFALGIIFNLVGIGYMVKQFKGANYGEI